MQSPCLDCNKRHTGCHTYCEDYQKYRSELTQLNEKIREDENPVYEEYKSDQKFKSIKRRRNHDIK